MSVLLSRQPTIPQKQNPPKIFPIPRKPQILKKNFFRINIITNISKPRIKSAANGFRQIS